MFYGCLTNNKEMYEQAILLLIIAQNYGKKIAALAFNCSEDPWGEINPVKKSSGKFIYFAAPNSFFLNKINVCFVLV